jgi:predicted acetyltransferase
LGALIVSIEKECKSMGSVGCTATVHKYRNKGIATNMILLGTKYLKDIGLRKAFLGYTYTYIINMYGD